MSQNEDINAELLWENYSCEKQELKATSISRVFQQKDDVTFLNWIL